MDQENVLPSTFLSPPLQLRFQDHLGSFRNAFELNLTSIEAGDAAVRSRSDAVDHLIHAALIELQKGGFPGLDGTALLALGGYGRRELFPYSDVDLLYFVAGGIPVEKAAESAALLSRVLWDAGLRTNLIVRTYSECERFDPENVEFTLSLFDARYLEGDLGLALSLTDDVVRHLIATSRESITSRLLQVTRNRHARFGNTLFHLEPDIKQCPGGLRDAHVCQWLQRLLPGNFRPLQHDREFSEARRFLVLTRTFLHFRHGRDDNTLEWRAQDAAADLSLGMGQVLSLNPAAWMRQYFRHARAIDSGLRHLLDEAAHLQVVGAAGKSPSLATIPSSAAGPLPVQAGDPEKVLSIFVEMAATGERLPSRARDPHPAESPYPLGPPGRWPEALDPPQGDPPWSLRWGCTPRHACLGDP